MMTDGATMLPDRPKPPSPTLAVNLDLARRFAARAQQIGVNGAEVLNVCMGDWLRRFSAAPFAGAMRDHGQRVELRLSVPSATHSEFMRECERRKTPPAELLTLLLASLNED